jgi:site-specific recombinase XerD
LYDGDTAPTEQPPPTRSTRRSSHPLSQRDSAAKQAADLPKELELHCLRHSYITHLTEFDYPERFIQDQAGHGYASTTALYTGVSDEYRNRLLHKKLGQRFPGIWEDPK